MSARGIPVQELLENQAPEVAYNLIEVTGEKIPLSVPEVVEEKPAKRRGRPPKAKAGEPDDAAESGDAGAEDADD